MNFFSFGNNPEDYEYWKSNVIGTLYTTLPETQRDEIIRLVSDFADASRKFGQQEVRRKTEEKLREALNEYREY